MTDQSLDALLQQMNAASTRVASMSEDDPDYESAVAAQEEIRAQLRSFDYDQARPRREVEEELKSLRAQLATAEGDRIGTIKGRFTGADLAVGGKIPATDINRRLDESNRVTEIEERIAHLEEILANG